jgi:hypothetical protein
VIDSSAVLVPKLAVVVHDAKLFRSYPGINSTQRLAVQLVPQLVFLGFYNKRTVKHLASTDKGGVCCRDTQHGRK